MKRNLLAVLALTFGACMGSVLHEYVWPRLAFASSCALKVWGLSDTVQASDLNSNFSCLNAATRGTGGATLVQSSDIAAGAITTTQLASGAVDRPNMVHVASLPVGWATLGTTACTSGTCVVAASYGVTSITFVSTGVYTVIIPVRADANYLVLLSAESTANSLICEANTQTASQFTVDCFNSGGAANVTFGFIIMDDE